MGKWLVAGLEEWGCPGALGDTTERRTFPPRRKGALTVMTLGPYPLNSIITGDARVLAKAIPDNSVALIFTDPVYQNIDDYRWLAETAARVLKDGGMVLAQVGSEFRYDAETAMMPYLTPLPLLAEVYHMAFRRMWKYRVMQGWKPYLWFYKGESRNGGFVFDRFHSRGADKRFHRWGDSTYFATTYINALTSPNDAIVDFFTGSGMIPAVCKILNRNYLAFEIDPATAELARQRIANTQSPLPGLVAEQVELL